MANIFFEKIRERASELGISRNEFCKRVGITNSQLYYYRDAKMGPSIFVADAMAETLGLTLDQLMGREKKKFNDCSYNGDGECELPDRISVAAAISNVTRRDILKKAGLCPGTLTNMRHGSQPSLNSLCKIADVLNVSLDWLWEGTK